MKIFLTILYIGVVLLLAGPAWGQDGYYADSLHKLFKSIEENDPERMRQLADECLQSTGKSQYWRVEAEACMALGKYNWYAVNFPASLQWYSRALTLAEKFHNRQLVVAARRGMGSVYLWEQNFAAALAQFRAAAGLAGAIRSDTLLSDVYIDLGLYYRWEGNAALDRNQALNYYHKAADIKQLIHDTSGLARVYNCIGSVYLDLHDTRKALDTSLLALKLVNVTNDKYRKAKICKTLAFTYYELQDNRNAEQYGLTSLELYHETSVFEGLTDANEILSLVYERMGRYQEALERFRAYSEANDKVNSKISSRLLTQMQLKMEQDRKDLIAVNRLAREKQWTAAAVIIAVLLLGLAVVAGMAYRRKKLDNILISKLVNEQEKTIEIRTAELAAANKKLQYSNNKLLELIQYNAHNLREPLTRIMGAMNIKPDIDPQEYESEVWPQMQKAVTDLDNSIQDVIRLADETVGA